MTKKTKRIIERAREYLEKGYTVFEAVRRAQREIEQEEKEREKNEWSTRTKIINRMVWIAKVQISRIEIDISYMQWGKKKLQNRNGS